MTQETSIPNESEVVEAEGSQAAESENEAVSQNPDEGKQPNQEQDKNPVPKWAQRRFDALTKKRHEAETRAQMVAEENERLKAIIEGRDGEEAQKPQSRTDPDQIKAQAVKEAEFNLKCNAIHAEGVKNVEGFKDALDNLGKLGALTHDVLEVIVEADNPAKVIAYLGSDLDEADRILSLSPVQMARAIGKLEATLSTQEKPVSKAPAPVKPVSSSRSVSSKDPSDSDDISTWMRKERDRMKASRGR